MTAASKPGWSAEARGFLAFLRVLLIVAAAALVYGVAWLLWPPTPTPLPPGATRLELRTQESSIGSRLQLGRPAALFVDMRVARDGGTMTFVAVGRSGGAEIGIGTGVRVDPVWPAGWSARLVGGRAELVSPDGVVVAREGDVIRGLGGGAGFVCLIIGSMPVVEPAPTGARFPS